jgi:type IV pilus assembly protein PilX
MMKFRPTFQRRKPQQGFALVVALLLLVALSFIGVSSLRNVSLQERMAGNTYYRILSSHEADAGLRLARASIDKVRLDPTQQFGSPAPSGWQDSIADSSITFWTKDSNWTSGQLATSLGTIGSPVETRWNVEQLAGTIPQCPSQSGTNSGSSGCKAYFLRSTSRALDSVTGATSVLQDWAMFAAD